jgi:hypothetical protein
MPPTGCIPVVMSSRTRSWRSATVRLVTTSYVLLTGAITGLVLSRFSFALVEPLCAYRDNSTPAEARHMANCSLQIRRLHRSCRSDGATGTEAQAQQAVNSLQQILAIEHGGSYGMEFDES